MTLRKNSPAPGAAPLGLLLFLLSLAVLFGASLVAYFAVRAGAEAWPPPGAPSLPRSLWASTALLLVSSGTMHWALRGARAGDARALRRGMAATAGLGAAFLVAQGVGWWGLAARELTMNADLYGFTFYMLTGLHALHMIGGLIPLGVTTVRAFRDRYTPHRHTGVVLCSMYWHFLDGVWLVIFVTLLAAG